jgi:hypothetical protein
MLIFSCVTLTTVLNDLQCTVCTILHASQENYKEEVFARGAKSMTVFVRSDTIRYSTVS